MSKWENVVWFTTDKPVKYLARGNCPCCKEQVLSVLDPNEAYKYCPKCGSRIDGYITWDIGGSVQNA